MPLPPADDPFYSPPVAFEKEKPGAILHSRAMSYPLTLLSILLVNIQGIYQLLYRTINSLKEPKVVFTTIIVPPKVNTTKLLG